MIALIRTVIVGCVMALLATSFFAFRYACSPADELETIRRREELQRLERATFEREEARRQIVRHWIAGQCTLVEMIAKFQEWDHQWPDYSKIARLMMEDDKRCYQQIAVYIEEVLHDRPEEVAAILSRLEKEYSRLKVGKPSPSPSTADQPASNR
jgi:hypothetical protein